MFIPDDEPIVLVDDCPPFQLPKDNVIRWDRTTGDLRPQLDRVVIDDCQGRDVVETARDVTNNRLAWMAAVESGNVAGVPDWIDALARNADPACQVEPLRQRLWSRIHAIIQVDRLRGGVRKVTSVTEILGVDGRKVRMQEIFCYRTTGINERGIACGHFEVTGVRPAVMDRIEAAGFRLPQGLFIKRVIGED
jgi:pilus assembly protein CpaF